MKRALAIALAALVAAPTAAPAAAVTTMVVGREQRVMHDVKDVRVVSQRRVKVGGKRCAVAGATPLGVLSRLGLKVKLRDYGSCGKRQRDAGGLFVRAIGSEGNRGQNGWVYKVNRRTGSTGAADPSGPFGSGRIRGGDRLLWFWCKQGAKGCQRTLEAVPDRTAVVLGDTVRVTVRGYDDRGKGVPVAGVAVRLGSASAVTGADGVASVTVADVGRLKLVADRDGMVRSFPREVRAT